MIDLQKYCHHDSVVSPNICKPFTQNGMTWATNGDMAIGVPAIADVPENKNAPEDIVKTLEGNLKPGQWLDIPKFDIDKCKICSGKGTDADCVECDGEGSVYFENEFSEYPDIRCASCDGDGSMVWCYQCKGSGVYSKDFIKAGVAFFDPCYLWLIKDLPKIQISPIGKEDVAFLRFDGGRGFLMPVRYGRKVLLTENRE